MPVSPTSQYCTSVRSGPEHPQQFLCLYRHHSSLHLPSHGFLHVCFCLHCFYSLIWKLMIWFRSHPEPNKSLPKDSKVLFLNKALSTDVTGEDLSMFLRPLFIPVQLQSLNYRIKIKQQYHQSVLLQII